MSATATHDFSHSLFDGVIARGAAVKDSAPRLSYYASQLPGKETWFQTPEGYRIYKNVPIARTGSQQYLGREIKKNPGYKPEWNIADEDLVTVYRPIEEVTAAETLASFEGKSVLDEHPADPQVLIDIIDEYDGITKGHVANLRVGDTLDDGETSLVADLWVKNPDLNVKVDDGRRDVSCGYTFFLDKDSDGRYIQKKIRGNHVAVVPRGRAGSEVGIKDAAVQLHSRRTNMAHPFRTMLTALGFQTWAKDAKPAEIAEAIEELKGTKDAEDEPVKKAAAEEEAGRDKAKDKKGTKDKKSAKDAPEHPKGCMCDAKDCVAARAAKDEDEDEFGDDEMTDSDEVDEEKKEEAKDKKSAKDDDALILPADEHSNSEFSVGDAARHLDTLKPLVAKSKDKGVREAYKALRGGFRKVQSGVKDGAPDPFQFLASISKEGGVDDGEPEVPMFQFFNGKTYAEGIEAYNKYQAARATKQRS